MVIYAFNFTTRRTKAGYLYKFKASVIYTIRSRLEGLGAMARQLLSGIHIHKSVTIIYIHINKCFPLSYQTIKIWEFRVFIFPPHQNTAEVGGMAEEVKSTCSFRRPSLIPSSHARWLTVTSNSSFRGPDALLLASEGTVLTHTDMHMHITKKTVKCMKCICVRMYKWV